MPVSTLGNSVSVAEFLNPLDETYRNARKIMTAKDIIREMEELYDGGMTLEQVGERFGITRQGVRHRFVKAGIIRRRPAPIDKKRLETLYSADKLPIPKIAAVFSVSIGKIQRALKTYEIPRRPSLKKGGIQVDFLRSLEIGKTEVIKWRSAEKYAHLHHAAKLVGIKISIRSRGDGEYAVTRLE